MIIFEHLQFICYWVWINSPKVISVYRNVNQINKYITHPTKKQKFAEMKIIPYFLPVVYVCIRFENNKVGIYHSISCQKLQFSTNDVAGLL